MDNNNLQPTPEQKIKRAKIILWLGIALIIIIGLAVAVYFVFIKTAGQGNVNASKNTNTAVNTNSATNVNVASNTNTGVTSNAEIYNGTISTSCDIDSECRLVDKTKDYSECCPTPPCDDYSKDNYIAVNKESFNQLVNNLKSQKDCQNKICPLYELPKCPATNNENYLIKCLNSICEKVNKSSVVSVAEALKDSTLYKDRFVCLTGYYWSAFELSAMGSSYVVTKEGEKAMDSIDWRNKYVWISVGVQKDKIDCENDIRGESCFGETVACGQFKVTDNDKLGLGHLGAYKYALE